jgi:hypothetical protein
LLVAVNQRGQDMERENARLDIRSTLAAADRLLTSFQNGEPVDASSIAHVRGMIQDADLALDELV